MITNIINDRVKKELVDEMNRSISKNRYISSVAIEEIATRLSHPNNDISKTLVIKNLIKDKLKERGEA